MTLHDVLTAVIVLFPISEVCLGLAKRRTDGTRANDRGSLWLLWFVVAVSCGGALALKDLQATRLDAWTTYAEIASTGFLAVGLAVRWWAIVTLGRFFTLDLATHADQWVVKSGPYRWVRHPSYTGLLIAFIGIGLYLGNWLSVAALLVPTTLAVLRRITIEEAILRESLGSEYEDYGSRSKRLIPWVV